MDFAFDARTEELRTRLLTFMDEHVYPAEEVAEEQRARLASPWDTPQITEDLKAEARRQGLWNLFLPDAEYGAGLTNLQYAPLAEITGRSPHLAPTALNCAAPDTGNMEVLSQFGSDEQKAGAAAGRRDPLGVRDDGARRGLVGRDEHRDADRPRR